MRIIGGSLKGRKFGPDGKKKWKTRPTTDRAREAIINTLLNRYEPEKVRFLDLFAGFGGMSFEWASRGCTDITSIENYSGCVRLAKDTAKELGIEEHIQFLRMDVFQYLKGNKESFDIIFADPPYSLPGIERIPEMVAEYELLKESGLLIVEHSNQTTLEQCPGFEEERKYGQSVFSFFNSNH